MNDTESVLDETNSSRVGKNTTDDNGGEEAGGRDDAVVTPREIGGRKGPEPVRYGDWEKNGRCIDF